MKQKYRYVTGKQRVQRVAGWLSAISLKALARMLSVTLLVALAFYLIPVDPRAPFEIIIAPDFSLDGPGTNVDSIAFWEAPEPIHSRMFVTAKNNAFVEIWAYPFDIDSALPILVHPCIDSGTNGVVVDQSRDLLYVSVRSSANVCVFGLPGLTWVRTIRSEAAYHSEPNLGLLHLGASQTRLYVTDDNMIYIHDAESGNQLSKFFPIGDVETIVGDDFYQVLYVPDENDRNGVYTFDPNGNVIGSPYGAGGIFNADAEGIVIYTCTAEDGRDQGEGFIVVSDQRGALTDFEFFDRKTKAHLGILHLSGVGNTDGIASTQQRSPAYPLGMLAAINDDRRVVGVGWARIFNATGLSCPLQSTEPR